MPKIDYNSKNKGVDSVVVSPTTRTALISAFEYLQKSRTITMSNVRTSHTSELPPPSRFQRTECGSEQLAAGHCPETLKHIAKYRLAVGREIAEKESCKQQGRRFAAEEWRPLLQFSTG